MKRILIPAMLAGLSWYSTQALADDSMSRVTPTNSQMMKDCIQKQKSSDMTMSKAQMKQICKDQLKAQKQTGAPAEAPPTDTPHN
jgi:hypothetical protein